MDDVPDNWPSAGPDAGPRTVAERIDDAMAGLDELRNRPAVAGGAAVVVVLLVVAGWWLGRPARTEPVEERIPQVQLQTTEATSGPPGRVVVHVSGAVEEPGVYVLDEAARVVDAVEAAGGATVDADLHQLNLAALVVDGMQVWIPAEGEVIARPSPSGELEAGPVDINRADAGQLETLPGVGPATAAAIIGFRDEHGAFRSVEDLLDVPGIGPAKLAGLLDSVIVR